MREIAVQGSKTGACGRKPLALAASDFFVFLVSKEHPETALRVDWVQESAASFSPEAKLFFTSFWVKNLPKQRWRYNWIVNIFQHFVS